jgi:hypothetical protein
VPGLIVEHRQGAVAAEIVKAAGERHAAMIVMRPQIRTDLRWRALGSVAAAVLRALWSSCLRLADASDGSCIGCSSRKTVPRRALRR